MAPEFAGDLDGAGIHVGVAVSRWNDLVTRKLLSGAKEALAEMGVEESGISIAWVPGAFELPLAAQSLVDNGCDAVIALGCVIRGDTDHYTHVATECARGLMSVSLASGKPVALGVLTTENLEQALERSGTKLDNKGYEAAQSAVELARLTKAMDSST